MTKVNVRYDLSARAVVIDNIIQRDEPYVPTVDSKISISITGLKNPYTNETTDSFQMTTFNLEEGQFYYYIDKVENGLTINSKCNYPCKTCPENDPETCLSCYQDIVDIDDGLPFRQEGTCVAECSTSRFYNLENEHCDLCNPTCLDCDISADNCIVCGVDEFLFLHEAQCLVECPDGFIEKPNSNECKPCSSNCMTCENIPTSCTSCDPDGDYPFFFHNNCTAECPAEISVNVDG